MTQHEAAKRVVANKGNCISISCDDCPAGPAVGILCVDSWIREKWFKEWLKRNPETEEVEE